MEGLWLVVYSRVSCLMLPGALGLLVCTGISVVFATEVSLRFARVRWSRGKRGGELSAVAITLNN